MGDGVALSHMNDGTSGCSSLSNKMWLSLKTHFGVIHHGDNFPVFKTLQPNSKKVWEKVVLPKVWAWLIMDGRNKCNESNLGVC